MYMYIVHVLVQCWCKPSLLVLQTAGLQRKCSRSHAESRGQVSCVQCLDSEQERSSSDQQLLLTSETPAPKADRQEYSYECRDAAACRLVPTQHAKPPFLISCLGFEHCRAVGETLGSCCVLLRSARPNRNCVPRDHRHQLTSLPS